MGSCLCFPQSETSTLGTLTVLDCEVTRMLDAENDLNLEKSYIPEQEEVTNLQFKVFCIPHAHELYPLLTVPLLLICHVRQIPNTTMRLNSID